SDDAEESVSGGSVTLSSSDLELTQENDNQVVGIRFQDINIPRGAVIENAYIEFECDEASSVSTSLTLRGESSDNALSFGSSSYNISSRADTSSSVNWNSLPSWSVDQKYQTPNLSSIVQEIVNRGGWNSGNSLSFTITGSGTRVAESYDGESQNAPLLYVKYSPTGTACVRSNGDANGDGRAALYDYAVWANYFAPFVRNYGGPTVGDFNCDNYVDLTDYAIWANYFTPI
ncbi:hypothetical protein JXA63_00365, partial [Candidatus Woesebacteria bacterium]|nr:hypothetical protein [Candidatus Woesebacteria bacterium]